MPAFPGLTTDRLSIRSTRADDSESLWQRRNDPEAARFQSWALPFPRERADEMSAAFAAADGPTSDDWWMATVCDRTSGEIVGDLALHLTFDARSAEIGFTFARSVWGRGYATEAAAALTDWLVDEVGVSRVSGMTHPDNLASVTVLERVGMVFEGRTHNSYWVGDVNSDDLLFGMTATDRIAWRARPRTQPEVIELVDITRDNEHEVQKLATYHSQRAFVSTVMESFADALLPALRSEKPVTPWLRAIAADGDLVGFVMMAEPSPSRPNAYLWRFMVDRRHQRRGVGRRALDLVIDQARAWSAPSLELSYVEGPGSPERLYHSVGFVPTGEVVDGEIEARLPLPRSQ